MPKFSAFFLILKYPFLNDLAFRNWKGEGPPAPFHNEARRCRNISSNGNQIRGLNTSNKPRNEKGNQKTCLHSCHGWVYLMYEVPSWCFVITQQVATEVPLVGEAPPGTAVLATYPCHPASLEIHPCLQSLLCRYLERMRTVTRTASSSAIIIRPCPTRSRESTSHTRFFFDLREISPGT